MQQPLISIVLPTYNGQKYIRQSIDSCLAQSYRNIELVVVNDCSTDNTRTIVEEYMQKDQRVRLVNNAVNKKLPLSLNVGSEAAQGQYITWTSDDNYYAPQAIEKMYQALAANPQVDLVYSDYTLIDENGKQFGTRTFNDINESFFRWNGCGACFLYKKEVHYAINGYNPATFLMEDYDFFVRAYTRFNFKYLPGYDLYYYREHPDSLTANHANAAVELQKTLQERYITLLSPKIGAHETMLLQRKLAVYYAIFRNDTDKTFTYLQKVYATSKGTALVTAAYIILRKLSTTAKVIGSVTLMLFRLPFSGSKK